MDIKFGSKSENRTKPLLEKHFNISLVQSINKYATYDYYTEDKQKWFELKTRRTYKNQYPDVMVGANKISKGLRMVGEGKDVYICWKFTDKLCYYKLDKDTLKNEWRREGGRTDRGRNEIDMLYYIPTDVMIDIE